ncbi:hypothetical protein PRIC2_008000 [Phytophthora ramorum]
MTTTPLVSDASFHKNHNTLGRNGSRRSSIQTAMDRLRRSTTFTSTTPLRNSLMRPRSNSVELLLFEVQDALDPNSSFVHVWQQLLLLCVVYEISILPYLVVFRDNTITRSTGELILVYVSELFFLADVYVELNTGFYEGGDITRDARKSRVRYLKSPRFYLDMLALLPLSLLPLKTPVSIAFFEMHKLIRVWRIPKYIARLDDVYARYFVVLKMFKVFVGILLLSHFIACIRFLFGYDEHGEDHWLPHLPDHEQTVRTRYLMSIFWAFGVMTGLFEGELPHTISAFIFTIFVAICGFLLFTYLCATFFMISKCESQNEASEARINQFKHLLSFHHVPEELQHQAIGYLKRYYTYTESNDREAMRLLCPSIRKDVQVAQMKDQVASVVIFRGCNDQFIVAITSLLEMISLPAYFCVFKAGDRGDAMYFVNSGVLHVIVDGVKVNFVYFWFVIPTRLAFEVLNHPNWLLSVLNVLMEIALWVDIYLNFNLSYINNSEKIWDPARTARRYFQNNFAFDLLCALPHWAMGIEILQLLRLLLACLHFSITYLEGFSSSPHAWLPSSDLHLRRLNETYYVDADNETYAVGSSEIIEIGLNQYFRSLYYACYVITALGRPVEPASDTQFGAALVFMLSGFFITAIVVDNVQKRFTASAYEQKEFFANRTRIQLFLMRQNAPLAIHKRVSAFLDFWWSAHRGAVIGALLEELPTTIKHDIMKSVCKPALQTIALLAGVRSVLNELEQVFIENVKFILYGQGEVVYRQGDFAGGLFFLLEGELCVIANGGAPRSIPQGSFVGTAALHFDTSSPSYSERVMAISGCIVLFISRDHLRLMQTTFPTLSDALHALEKRFLDPKFLKASEMSTGTSFSSNRPYIITWISELVFDPDSNVMIVWEAWIFIVMTVQCLLTVSIMCFPVSVEANTIIDIIIFLFEVIFMADMFVRFRLGFHEFGNKVMDLRVIKKNYLHSRSFVLDAVALFPLYFIDWGMVSCGFKHVEILNLNKLVRLFKVPAQFAALENKHLKFTLQLRLFKLVYYTFILSHTLGCFYFDFRSHASHMHGALDAGDSHQTSHSANAHWLPEEALLEEGYPLQYFSSLFWSFGVMSATYPGELPKTTSQCLFNTITLTFGFFLFAYVIGNFSDIIELMDAENREYYATLSSFRHLLEHFRLPAPIQERFKAYFFFKRFHSITQEHLLESCLPPSLLTDIRMVHLQPMIVKVSFLAGMNGSVTRMLVSHFSQVMIVKDEFVYRYGEEGSDMYFVFAGLLDTLIPREEELRQRATAQRASIARRAPTESSLLASKPGIKPLLSSRKVHPRPLSEWTSDKLDLDELTKLNQVTAGDYFGENALFVDSVRNAFVLAKSTTILYKLSRNSLETVFNRYPEWKQKVIRVINLQQQQQRLTHIAKLERHNSVRSTMTDEDHMNAYAERMEEAVISARYKRSTTASAISKRETISRHPAGPTSPRSGKAEHKLSRLRCGIPMFLSVLFRGAPAQSVYHLTWIKVIIFATLFMSIVVPYRISFDSMEHNEWLPVVVREIEILCEVLYLADIWINWRIQRSSESVDLYEQDHRETYKSERLVWDILAAIPLDYFFSSFSNDPLYRINRCLKLRNFLHYMDEINRSSIYKEMHRLRTASALYVLIMYWSACMYFAIAVYDHFGDEWNAWLPDSSLSDPKGKRTLRLLRGCFFATTSFIKKGRTFQPDTIFHFAFCIIVCFVGLLTMAFMIGEFANLFISYISNEVEYRKNHIAVELYLGRWKITGELKTRTQAFLSSLWSSHRGVDYQSFLEGVPACIRTDSILVIAQVPLHAFISDVFRPLPRSEVLNTVDRLMHDIARHLSFEGYPRGENVLVEGSITKSMYFVVRGNLFSTSESQPNRSLSYSKGTHFGEKGLLVCSVSTCTIRTLRACDLLSLSPDSLLHVIRSHRCTKLAYEIASQAVQIVTARERVASPVTATETEWGEALIRAIRMKHVEVVDNGTDDVPSADLLVGLNAADRARKSALELIESYVALERAIDAFGAFRPLLQLIVPNGQLHTVGGTKVEQSVGEKGPTLCESEAVTTTTDEQHVQALAIIQRLFHKKYNAVAPAGSHRSKREASVASEVADTLVQHELARVASSPTTKVLENR